MPLLIFIFGLIIGSFLNAYIWRMHCNSSVWRGRSHCPKCHKVLHWYELIPVVSFVIQRGKCRNCKQSIDIQYPLVEVVTGILFILGFWALNIGNLLEIGNWKLVINLLISWYLLSILVVLFIYDLRYGLVPDKVVLPAIAIALIFNIFKQPTLLAISHLLLATFVGALFFATQYYLSRGKWLGDGDIRIGALMGAMLGWPLICEGLVVSYVIGGVVGVLLLMARRKKLGQTLPLGTFLTLGTAIVFLYGEIIWKWYWM